MSDYAPSKQRVLDEDDLVRLLMRIPVWVDAIVLHPDTIQSSSGL